MWNFLKKAAKKANACQRRGMFRTEGGGASEVSCPTQQEEAELEVIDDYIAPLSNEFDSDMGVFDSVCDEKPLKIKSALIKSDSKKESSSDDYFDFKCKLAQEYHNKRIAQMDEEHSMKMKIFKLEVEQKQIATNLTKELTEPNPFNATFMGDL